MSHGLSALFWCWIRLSGWSYKELEPDWDGMTSDVRSSITYSIVNSPPYSLSATGTSGPIRNLSNRLTANTRSREDLPAFWRPIMVTSISLALYGVQHGFICGDGPWSPENCIYQTAHLPEHPQKPVIDSTKYASHDEEWGIWIWKWKWKKKREEKSESIVE